MIDAACARGDFDSKKKEKLKTAFIRARRNKLSQEYPIPTSFTTYRQVMWSMRHWDENTAFGRIWLCFEKKNHWHALLSLM